MCALRDRTNIGLVPAKLAIRVGLVEGPRAARYSIIFYTSRPVFLAGRKDRL